MGFVDIPRCHRNRTHVFDQAAAEERVSLDDLVDVLGRHERARAAIAPAGCDAHHIICWRNHGHTTLDNLLMLCGRHHRTVHRDNWHIRLLPNGSVEFVLPDNRLITTQPRGQPTIRAA